jgi:hypothetical protein
MVETIKRSRARKRRLTDAEVEAQIPAARARESKARAAGLRAKSARYDETTGRVVLELTNGIGFAFPARVVRGLERATAAQRAALTLSPSGGGVIWEDLDADISVRGVVASTIGRKLAASALGAAGGKSRSRVKVKAARANGAKGGRPRR